MDIKILGLGCAECNLLYENVRKAVEELGMSTEIEHVNDIKAIMEYDIMITPALAVNNKTKCQGVVPDVREIKKMLLAERNMLGKAMVVSQKM